MFKQIALTAILTIAFTITINGQPLKNSATDSKADGKWEESIGGAEAAKAIARLGDLTPAAIRERLKQMRQPDYPPNLLLMHKIIEAQHMPIADGKRVDRLKAALQPVLDYHGRSQMPIYVLRSEQPKAYLAARTVIIITTRLMMIGSEEEIRGIVAHELAHEYVWEDVAKAMKAKDWELRRECEMFCDAVAAFTLKEIGDDPASYGRILEHMTIIGINAGNLTMRETHSHPSLGARKTLNKFLCQRFD